MKKVTVVVTLKEGVLDPQGKAVLGALHNLSYKEVSEVRVGKTIELMMEDRDNPEARIKEMCEKLLANTVIEDYSYTVEEGVAQ